MPEINSYDIKRADEDDSLIGNGLTGGMRKRGRYGDPKKAIRRLPMNQRMAGGVRDKITMAKMKASMAAHWANNETYVEIAEAVSDEFGLEGDERFKANGIHYHIKEQLAYWRQKGLVSIDEKQAMVLARYAQLEEICTNALFASMEGKTTHYYEKQIDRARGKTRQKWIADEIKHEKEKKTKYGITPTHESEGLEDRLIDMQERIKEYTREEMSAGEAKWMAFLIDINHKRAQIWGLLSKRDIPSQDQEMARLSDDQRFERMGAVLRQVLHRVSGDKGNLAPSAPLGGKVQETQYKYNKEAEDAF